MREKIIKIIEIIYDRAVNKKAIWQKTGDGFLISVNTNTLTIERYASNGSHYFIVELFNDRGQKIVSENTHYGLRNAVELVAQLYNLAHTQFYKIDETLDDLINDLENNPNKVIGQEYQNDDDDLPF